MNNNENIKREEDVKANLIASLIGISVSLLVVVLVFVFNRDTHINIKNIWDFNYYYVLIAIVLFLSVVFINGFRIKIMAKFMNNKISFLKATNSVFMGLYVSNITPSAVGGQPYQIYLMSQYGLEPGIATTIVVSQFVTTNIFNLILDLLFIPYLLHFSGMNYMWIPFIIGFSIFLFMIFSILLVSFNRKIISKLIGFFFNMRIVKWSYKMFKKDAEKEKKEAFDQIANFHDATIEVWSKKREILILDFFLASLSRILMLFIPYVFYLSFFTFKMPPLTIYDFIAVQIVTQHVAYFIPTPGSSGGFEASFLYLFSTMINPKILSMIVLGWRFITYYFVIIGGSVINIFTSVKMTKNLKTANKN